MAYPIDRASDDLGAWEKALKGITAGGGTSCGVAWESMTRKRQVVEQIILVTDEGENTAPLFLDSLRKYREAVKADPNVCFVRTPGSRPTRKAVPPGRRSARCVSVHGGLLRTTQHGAAVIPAVEAGIAHGSHGLPASHAEAGVVGSKHRGLLPDRKSVQTPLQKVVLQRTRFSSWNLQRAPVFIMNNVQVQERERCPESPCRSRRAVSGQ